MTAMATDKEAILEAASYAADLMNAGIPAREVEERLVETGVHPEAASAIVRELSSLDRGEAPPREGGHPGAGDMALGALIAVVGIVVTVVTYSMAANGGTYVVAWGAILFGGFRFFRGLLKT